MARLISAPKKFKILVANLVGASDPSKGSTGNPVKARTGFVQQVTSNNVTKIKTQGASVEGEFKNEVKFPNDKADASVGTSIPLPSSVTSNSSGQAGSSTRRTVTSTSDAPAWIELSTNSATARADVL